MGRGSGRMGVRVREGGYDGEEEGGGCERGGG